MNCKPGDLAIYVGWGSPKDLGQIVTCVKFLGDLPVAGGGTAPMWLVEPPLKNSDYRRDWVADGALRPIRPNDGEDEMIRIAGKPHDAHKRTTETA